jgi:hypothetical protein
MYLNRGTGLLGHKSSSIMRPALSWVIATIVRFSCTIASQYGEISEFGECSQSLLDSDPHQVLPTVSPERPGRAPAPDRPTQPRPGSPLDRGDGAGRLRQVHPGELVAEHLRTAQRGVALPAHLSIVGFDDIKLAGYLHPALTSVHQPYEEIACQAVELLVEMIRERAIQQPAPHIRIPPELVKRDSCAPPRR